MRKKFTSLILALAFATCPLVSFASETETEFSYAELLQKYEQLQKDYDELRKRYDELISGSNINGSETTKTLDDLEQYLLDCGVLEGEKTDTLAAFIGAISGFKYADSNAEFYLYDNDSDVLAELKMGEPITIEGFDVEMMPSSINGPFVLFPNTSGEPSQELIDAFNEFSFE